MHAFVIKLTKERLISSWEVSPHLPDIVLLSEQGERKLKVTSNGGIMLGIADHDQTRNKILCIHICFKFIKEYSLQIFITNTKDKNFD